MRASLPLATFNFLARVSEGATGTGSNITVGTRALIARNGSQIRTSTESSGRGGSVTVVASDGRGAHRHFREQPPSQWGAHSRRRRSHRHGREYHFACLGG
ncbi:MAG: hypothetical protein KME26_05070 [Oscillatoria princeps RMCB-10]|nr:hypothetical protein [Oscillatoria princeps RMCB-10]